MKLNPEISDDTKKIIIATKAGGEILRKYFGESLETMQKTIASNFRTKADLESEKAILDILEKEFPNYNILSEEKGEINKNSEFTFIIDPLDGTNNFVLGIPNFSISIGLVKNGKTLIAVIYNPISNNVYYAEKGKGAYCDDKKLEVNNELDIKNATICLNRNYETDPKEEIKFVNILYSKDVKRIMLNWSVALDYCMLASGKIEGIINNNSEIYDFIAGKLIAEEAGVLITDFNNDPEEKDTNRIFIMSNNNKIHQHLFEIVKK